jgi:hypothetical protein
MDFNHIELPLLTILRLTEKYLNVRNVDAARSTTDRVNQVLKNFVF